MATLPGWQPITGDALCNPLLKAGEAGACGFEALMRLMKNGMADLVLISTILVIVVLLTAGFKLVTAGMRGDSGALKEARGMFMAVVTGYAIILLAWSVVYTITSTLLKPGYSLLVK